MLKLKTRDNEIKKVLIFGLDGSGKSTYAEEYCQKHDLNPVCIDIDNTNFTNVDIVEIDLSTDLKTYQNMKSTIKEIASTDYDTIIIDGVSSLIELLVSKANGMKAYKDRSDRFSSILQHLTKTGKNLIFVGQIDMEVVWNDEHQSNKPVIKINSIVNEKYYTYLEKGQYLSETRKFRGVKNKKPPKSPKNDKVTEKNQEKSTEKKPSNMNEDDFKTADNVEKNNNEIDDGAVQFIKEIILTLKENEKPINPTTIKDEATALLNNPKSGVTMKEVTRVIKELSNNGVPA